MWPLDESKGRRQKVQTVGLAAPMRQTLNHNFRATCLTAIKPESTPRTRR
jgi:hypothetical protein